MVQYVCDQCGMGVTGMKCAKCGEELVHDHITTDDGQTVAVTKCPDGCGKIKSPMSWVCSAIPEHWPRFQILALTSVRKWDPRCKPTC